MCVRLPSKPVLKRAARASASFRPAGVRESLMYSGSACRMMRILMLKIANEFAVREKDQAIYFMNRRRFKSSLSLT